MSFANALHVLAAVLWVGGMFFAYVCLRPAAATLEAPQRLQLWAQVFARFFPWVGLAIALLLASGFWLFMHGIRGPHVHFMMGVGVLMMLLAGHVYFAPVRRLQRHAAAQQWTEAATQLGKVRVLIGINLALGLLVVAVAAAGRYGFSA